MTEHYVAVIICSRLYVKVTTQNSLIYLVNQKVAPKLFCYFFQKLWRAVVKVKVTDLHPVSLGSTLAGTHVSHWWRQEGHPDKIDNVHHKKSPTYVDTSEPLNRVAVNVV